MSTQAMRRGFTLVEVLIVSVILGLLAAIVLPQFANASVTARKTALMHQLQRLRSQVQLFKVQHGDATPALNGDNWTDLLNPSVFEGLMQGPYLSAPPRNMLNQFTTVLVVDEDPAFGDSVTGTHIGFVYNPATGVIMGTNTAGTRVFNEANVDDPTN